MSAPVYDPDTDLGPPNLLLDPQRMFFQDLVTDERDFPSMRDPERIPVFEIYARDHIDPRTPDIETARTKAYIIAWEPRRNHRVPQECLPPSLRRAPR